VLSQKRFEKTASSSRALFYLLKLASALQGDQNEPVIRVAGQVDIKALTSRLMNKNSGLTPSERNELQEMSIAKLLKTIAPSQMNQYITEHRAEW